MLDIKHCAWHGFFATKNIAKILCIYSYYIKSNPAVNQNIHSDFYFFFFLNFSSAYSNLKMYVSKPFIFVTFRIIFEILL